jgi:5,10-methenyltetrahydromethanopterin hydrogenase
MIPKAWQKSSYCGEGESCVHVAALDEGTVHLTESSDPSGVILSADPMAFGALVHALREERTRG